jgi:hypothetical protein
MNAGPIAGNLYGRSISGAIQGMVKDPSGAALPQVVLTLSNSDSTAWWHSEKVSRGGPDR